MHCCIVSMSNTHPVPPTNLTWHYIELKWSLALIFWIKLYDRISYSKCFLSSTNADDTWIFFFGSNVLKFWIIIICAFTHCPLVFSSQLQTRIKKLKKLGCPGTKRETRTEQRDESNKYRGVDTTQWYVNLSYEISEL